MSPTAVFDAIASLQNAVDNVMTHFDTGGLGSLSDEEFTEVALEVEATRRRLATADYALICGSVCQGAG